MRTTQHQLVRGSALTLALLMLGLLGFGLKSLRALNQVYTVNSTADTADATPGDGICGTSTGPCTLRAAIQEANAQTGADTINFSIPNSDPNRNATTGVFTITPASALPNITGPVTINGYSQPGIKANTLPVGSDAVRLITLKGERLSFQATAGGSTVRGLTIDNFNGGGLVIFGGDGYVIAGCNIKGGGNGLSGVHFFAGNNQTVGGLNSADRNVLDNIELRESTGSKVQNNYIGVNEQGTARGSSFQTGVRLQGGSNNAIGGPDARAGNVISGNGSSFGGGGQDGISIQDSLLSNGPPADNNLVQNNIIGLNAAGTAAIGNVGDGISIVSFSDPVTNTRIIGNVISGNGNTFSGSSSDGISISGKGVTATQITGNTIGLNKAHTNFIPNLGNGVAIYGTTATESTGNVISANFIAGNGKLGIDLGGSAFSGGDGVTANDTNDPDTGPNNRQNFPVLTSASGTATNTAVQGTLNSLPSTSFRIEFFANGAADPSGNGEGQTFLGFQNVTTAANGNATINATLPVPLPGSQSFVTATATRLSGTTLVETSEFSAARQATGNFCSLVVTNTNDAGAGSLRGAIQCANASNFVQTITFNIPGPTTTVKTINLTSPLPAITVPLTIDGFSQPGSSPFAHEVERPPGTFEDIATDTPARLLIELNGAGAGANANGLVFGPGSDGSTVRGLVINRFTGSGIVLRANNIKVAGNYIGTSADGSAALGNGVNGLFVDGGSNSVIGDALQTSSGPDTETTIRYFNLISANASANVRLATNAQGAGGTNNTLSDNYIGTDISFVTVTSPAGQTTSTPKPTKALGGGTGIVIDASGNRTGFSVSGGGNIIAGNAGPGIDIVRGDNNNLSGQFGAEINLNT
ncbi:MAG: CSLREA domain-containing protein, partial [Armatimonadota bacterium]|nr:CSLREA domain-containing protein [Armatimonadota bacterium]